MTSTRTHGAMWLCIAGLIVSLAFADVSFATVGVLFCALGAGRISAELKGGRR